VKRFAQDVVGPKVREMDENEIVDPSVMKGFFEQGVRSSLPPFSLYITHVRRSSWASKHGAEHGGAESLFPSTIIPIKELAKVDPSVSVYATFTIRL
jgi:short/branched chain acyl-CoA dehydrogenase